MTTKKKTNFYAMFATFGSLASIIALIIIFIPKQNSIELAVTTSLVENLTENNLNDPELTANYLFKGDTIDNLWKAVVEIENRSNKTLIISEKIRNVIDDNLKIRFEKGLTIIDIKLISQDFNNNINILNNGQVLGISFIQWRPKEKLKLYIYMQSKDSIIDNVFAITDERPIVDGDIVFYYENDDKKNSDIYSIIPFQIRMVAYVLIIITLLLLGLFLIATSFMSLFGFYKRRIWKKRELSKFNTFIIEHYKENKKDIDLYVNNPDKFYSWSLYDGDRYPAMDFDYNIEKGFPLLFVELFSIIGIATIALVIFDLIILFP